MGLTLLIFICFVGGLQAKQQDFRNQTVECSVNSINACFNFIPSLGGNFSVEYADAKQLNATCKQIGAFRSCVGSVPTACNNNIPKVKPAIDSIVTFVTKLCTNDTVIQKNFLNTTECYNKNLDRRRRCKQKYAPSKMDAKSLCCGSSKTQACMKNDMKNVCQSNYTAFQDKLIDTYSGYTNLVCEPYVQYCGAITNFLSVACLLLTVKLTLLNLVG